MNYEQYNQKLYDRDILAWGHDGYGGCCDIMHNWSVNIMIDIKYWCKILWNYQRNNTEEEDRKVFIFFHNIGLLKV